MTAFVAILGRQPELSAAELVTVAQSLHVAVSPINAQAYRVDAPPSFTEHFSDFGGLVKLGEVITHVERTQDLLTDTVLHQLFAHVPAKGKIVFGISAYGPPAFVRETQQLGKAVKVFLAENGRPARFLVGEQGVLSSVVVAKERLAERGMELMLVAEGQGILVAKTVAVQAFEDFSQRDYGRPKRDARSGMLPPKLARIMVNLAGTTASTRLLDPFCGSGTVLQEALLLGCRSLAGTDVSEKAVRETKENLAWLGAQRKIDVSTIRLRRADVADLGKHFLLESLDAIVTEPYLGPSRAQDADHQQQRELQQLYEKAFRVFSQLLRAGGRVVFLLPVVYQNGKPHFVMNLESLHGQGFRQIQPLPPSSLLLYRNQLSFRDTVVYHRPGQRIGREIVLFSKVER